MPSIQFSIEGRSKIHPTGRPPLRAFALQFYRFAVVATIAWLIRDVAVRQRIQGDSPVTAAEITSLLPGAATLRPDDSARDGLFALDREGRELGYVVRTQPACRDIIGYAGTTDALVVLDRDWRILGLKIHSSEDTESYIKDITVDRRFLKKWNGLTWDAAAALEVAVAQGARRIALLGFSMGGAVALASAGHQAVDTVIGLAPWLPRQLPIENLRGRRLAVRQQRRAPQPRAQVRQHDAGDVEVRKCERVKLQECNSNI